MELSKKKNRIQIPSNPIKEIKTQPDKAIKELAYTT